MDIESYKNELLKQRFKSYQTDVFVKELIGRIADVVTRKKDKERKITNEMLLFSEYDIFVMFFTLLGRGKYQVLEDVFDFKVTDEIQSDIQKWLEAEYNKEKWVIYNEEL